MRDHHLSELVAKFHTFVVNSFNYPIVLRRIALIACITKTRIVEGIGHLLRLYLLQIILQISVVFLFFCKLFYVRLFLIQFVLFRTSFF